jgi:preprotein translocase subunit SecB
MADEITPEAATEATQGPQFQLQKIYVKDVSFEIPGAPQIF